MNGNKVGEYIGLVKHTNRYEGEQMAVVHFFDNKRISRVPYKGLRFFTDDELYDVIKKALQEK